MPIYWRGIKNQWQSGYNGVRMLYAFTTQLWYGPSRLGLKCNYKENYSYLLIKKITSTKLHIWKSYVFSNLSKDKIYWSKNTTVSIYKVLKIYLPLSFIIHEPLYVPISCNAWNILLQLSSLVEFVTWYQYIVQF